MLREEPPYTSQPSGPGCSPAWGGKKGEQPELGRERGKRGAGMNPQPLSNRRKACSGKNKGSLLHHIRTRSHGKGRKGSPHKPALSQAVVEAQGGHRAALGGVRCDPSLPWNH